MWMPVRTFVTACCLSVAALTFSPVQAFAQVPSAGARVQTVIVRDSSGGTVEGAIVVLTRGTTERRATTAVDGVTRLTDLEPGDWILEVRKEGFALSVQSLQIGAESAPFTVSLEPPAISESVTVEARALSTMASSASRLELSLRELPATLNIVTQQMMQERGANTAMDAIEVAGGTLVSQGLGGQLPGYQTRGFAGNSIMNDGIRQNSSVQSSRPVDSFLLERVEVLKGPASLFAGEGGTAGTVNYVSKTPHQQLGFDSLLSYGSFNARRVGLGVTGPLGKKVMGRVDGSYSDGGGYAKPSSARLNALASSVWWTPSDKFIIKVNGRFTNDNVDAYYVTPFINGQVDPRMRFLNYNLQDAYSRGQNNFGRTDVDVALRGGWRLHNGTFYATQHLDYHNMESYSYNATTHLVDVSSYFLIWRRDLLVGNQTDLRKTVDVLGRSINLLVGAELQHNDMQRAKSPLNASTVRFSVDPFNPQPTVDPNLPYLRVPDVIVNNKTLYAEAQAKLASKWTAVLGLRFEQIGVNYGLAVTDTTTQRLTYWPATGRAGLVYAANSNVSLYGSYSRSVEPATQFISLSGCCGAATFFGLTPGRQFEAGIKGNTAHNRLEGTFAYFDIQKKNIPTTTIIDDVPTAQVIGMQISRGVEVSAVARPTSSFFITGDFALTHGLFSEFNEVVASVNVSRDGNTPTGIPFVLWSVTPTQLIGRVSVAASVRQVGKRWADTANLRNLEPYTTLDSWVSVRLSRGARLTARGRNLTDEVYITRPGTTSGRIGLPRSYEVALSAGF